MSADRPETNDSVLTALLAVADVLEAAGSRYALIGGLAAAQHGVIRATQDVDFLVTVSPVRLPGLLDQLRKSGCDLDETQVIREWASDHLTQFHYRGIAIDWLKPVIPLFRVVLDRAVSRHIRGHQIHVVDVEGLVLMKMAAFRPEDQRDVEALASACPDVDWPFIKQQLESVFGLDDQRLSWLRDQIAGWPG